MLEMLEMLETLLETLETLETLELVYEFVYCIRVSTMVTRIMKFTLILDPLPVYELVYCIRTSAYTNLRLYEPPLIRMSAYTSVRSTLSGAPLLGKLMALPTNIARKACQVQTL